jgi:AraC-like DNA-binding protein
MARYAQQLLDASPLAAVSADDSLLDDVRRAVLLLLPSGRCTVEQVSAQLGLVCRTVQRRLAEQQQSFSGLVNALRVELAQRHVAQGQRPLTDVAALLGFSALSGFSRWHQQQFGCSPSQARANAQAGPATDG